MILTVSDLGTVIGWVYASVNMWMDADTFYHIGLKYADVFFACWFKNTAVFAL